MQYGTMSVKNLVGRLGVHDKTDHTLVSQVTFARVTQFCENAPTIWELHRLKGGLKSGVFNPKA
ncbi:hypothetical protein GmHk_20G056706 [Glycine max]|nr:hypothetical protein GmHk_20G056706 [Glycine max]